MADTSRLSHVYAGVARSARDTIGGIFRRATGDDHWTQLTNGLPDATDVQAITIHPENPDVIYAGTNNGPYRSTDRGDHWERLLTPARFDYTNEPKSPIRLVPHTRVVQEFVNSILEDRQPGVPGEAGRAAVAICEACLVSARSAQAVTLGV